MGADEAATIGAAGAAEGLVTSGLAITTRSNGQAEGQAAKFLYWDKEWKLTMFSCCKTQARLAAIFTVVLAAVTATNAREWECSGFGGQGHDGLRRIHSDFNRLFGSASLRIGAGQCYVADCGGLVFAVCHDASYSKQEISNARNIAKDTDPGDGTRCVMNPTFGEYYLSGWGGVMGQVIV
ncbi:hypothetical protein V496_02303 [Pseudogymnoascus sp. VKM F-4515 (FW-2607)]|nr:hypothetical protein V496_02303 [Pseudogymnoascus sp. VKM F-4515 (FW-2607)]KFY83515.1 hypothetical protein V498_08014 [Pseudogymnoascus sp. VKM F-4517 (FW-2822)]